MARIQLSTASKIIILTSVLASLLEIIDTSIVNVAIPTMMGNLGATLEDISWVVTGYIIANAIVLPIAGWLGMQIGRKKYYVGCILLFTLTSVACGFAPNLDVLIIFRVIQGLAGGALLPTSQALIQEQFPREQAGIASAIYGMGVIIGPTLGPTMGGYLTDNFGWRMIFNINLPLGLLAASLAYFYVEDVKTAVSPDGKPVRAARTPIDYQGLFLLAAGVGCLQFVLERGQADDWFDSRAIVVCSLVAAIAIPAFILRELRARFPVMDLRLYKHSAVRNGTLLMASVGMFLYAVVFILPVFVNTVLGYTATQTGELFIPGAMLTGFLMPVAGMLLRKTDARLLILLGLTSVGICLFMMTGFNSQTGASELYWPLLVRGVGMAFLFVPINTVVLSQFSGQALGQVAGMMNLSRQLGGSIGIAGMATLLQRYNATNYVELIHNVSLLSPAGTQAYRQTMAAMQGKLAESTGFASASQQALKALFFRVQKQAFILSFSQVLWVLLGAFTLSLIPLSLIKVGKRPAGPVDAH